MTESQIQAIRISGEPPEQWKETHISYVLLSHMHAYKIKKPVKFSFLDFSTLAQRKYYCDQELTLNKRLAAEIYLAVVPIRQLGAYLLMESDDGKLVDYAVKMKRMRGDRQMHHLLADGLVTKNQIISIAEKIVQFHKETIICKPLFDSQSMMDDFNDIGSIKKSIRQQLGDRYANLVSDAMQFSDEFIRSNRYHLAQRIERGMIREGHGDLHSRNIFLDGKPIIFDCIEFSKDFRTIDVLDELAFFCMDLEVDHHTELSDLFMKTYIEQFPQSTSQPSDQKIFLYYKLYRANVRAKVNALNLKGAKMATGKESITELKKYLLLMEQYTKQLEGDLKINSRDQ
ncbi:MAG: hypothetical protein HKN87_19065 [Saprospiraceae bacterium]|nr:hypothetical protein [Saprospiraceae bacterium]